MFQIGSALLDACVLSVLSREDTYGYALTQSIQAVIDVSESTLYPVLRRLQKDSLLSTYDMPFNGRNRRYYRITAIGSQHLASLVSAWGDFKIKVDSILTSTSEGQGGGAL